MDDVLSFDPGADRCGWAYLRTGPEVVASGILGLSRTRNGKKTLYQQYRLELITYWLNEAWLLVQEYEPEVVATEIVPVIGGGTGGGNVQLALAAEVATIIQCVAELEDIEVVQISAGTVKRRIGGVKDASKVKVRNGVIELVPSLESRRREWIDTKVSDETDAIAVGLVQLGYEL